MNKLEALLDLLDSAGLQADAEELAEALWLGMRMAAVSPQAEQISGVRRETASKPDSKKPSEKPATQPGRTEKKTESPLATSTQPRTKPASEDSIALRAQGSENNPEQGTASSRSADGGGRAFRTPAVSMLTDALRLGRALKPLKQRVPSRISQVLDEAETVKQIAEHRLWLPVFRGASERWLEIALIVDSSNSMLLWEPTLSEFRRLLENHGAFNDVRLWRLAFKDDTVRLYKDENRDTCRSPQELLHPEGRRLVIVASDFVAPGWRQGLVLAWLRLWGNKQPVALLHMLPQRLWKRSALGAASRLNLRSPSPNPPNNKLLTDRTPSALRSPSPKPPNSKLRTDRTPSASALKLPVLTLEPDALHSWSRLIHGRGNVWVSGVAWSKPASSETPSPSKKTNTVNALQRLERFTATASPEAQELARYFATVPLTLQVMRLTQQTLLPFTRQAHLAEVFLSGLLQRVDNVKNKNPLQILMDFHPGIRDLLLDQLPPAEVESSARRMNHAIETHLGQSLDFLAILAADDGKLKLGANELPIARIRLSVLRRLGGEYSELAEQAAKRIDVLETTRKESVEKKNTIKTHDKPYNRFESDLEKTTGRQDKEADNTKTYSSGCDLDSHFRGNDDKVGNPKIQPVSNLKNSFAMTSFSWLHLTDLHLGQDQGWHRPGAEEKFFKDLKLLHKKCGPWDLVIFTGDLTMRGSKQEFEQIDMFLEKLWINFHDWGFSPKLLAVPGNHDLVRPNIKELSVRCLSMWNEEGGKDIREEFWDNKKSPYRRKVEKIFEPYLNWWKKQSKKPKIFEDGLLPGDFSATIEKDGAKMGVIGLNTGFLQFADGDYEKSLAIHLKQFHAPCGDDGPAWAKRHHVCLLLTHHPSEWLNQEAKDCLEKMYFEGHFSVHLCGHTDQADYVRLSQQGDYAKNTWRGHSLFGLEFFGGHKRPYGYSVGKIELHKEYGRLFFWPRKLNHETREEEIVPDFSFRLDENNQYTAPQHVKLNQIYDESGKELEAALLCALYAHPDSNGVPFKQLQMAIEPELSLKYKEGDILSQIRCLKNKGWISVSYEKDHPKGIIKMTREGNMVVEERRQVAASRQAHKEHGLESPCPASLEELAQRNEKYARFVHRYELLDTISEIFCTKKCHLVVLYGQTMVGKTKVLECLAERLLEKEHVPLTVTAQGVNEIRNLDGFLLDLAEQLAKKSNAWARKINDPSVIPPSLNPDNFSNGKGRKAFNEYWKQVIEIIGKPTVIMYDELEQLLDMPGKNNLGNLRILAFIHNFISEAKNGCIIISVSERVQKVAKFKKMLAKTKGQCVKVGYYEKKVVVSIFDYIKQYVIDECRLVQRFIALSDGHPHILQTVLRVISHHMQNSPYKQKITEDDFKKILKTILERVEEQLWMLRWKLSDDEFYVAWLISREIPVDNIQFEYSSVQMLALANKFHQKGNFKLEQGISGLEEREWIERKSGNIFLFKLGIFPLWIQRNNIEISEKQ